MVTVTVAVRTRSLPSSRVSISISGLSTGSIPASLTANSYDGLKNEYIVLRAVGATRSQLVARLASAAFKTAIFGIILALPFGALAGWLFAIKTALVWPGMPHYFVVPWQIIAEGAVGAVLFALLVALPTAMMIIKRATKRTSA